MLLALVAGSPAAGAGAAAPEISSSAELARAGYYQLRWVLDEADVARYRVEEDSDPGFPDPVALYEGADRATVVSGRSDGIFHYRARATLADGSESAWSETLTVEVAHHPRAQAFGIFTVGGLVFLATAGLIVAGTRAERRRERQR
ncbi:signal peptide protein [Thioalkalivibrio paradoxus ARh 1]|uniref:Signal peptide protein n=1 Tax=Thioalkalivibrio paradoxus ARh 1 TaxID=713585 RepID=W0DRX5_9GAMM|nr:signal peptide protein [Thioalkalivibrio paradoxus ARh 1]